MKSFTFTLTPTNEGQPLNYSETLNIKASTYDEAKAQANIRENEIIAGLMDLMPEGSWDCEVEEA